jgi:hypothetical protein
MPSICVVSPPDRQPAYTWFAGVPSGDEHLTLPVQSAGAIFPPNNGRPATLSQVE